jgi:hypothetical protein
LQDFQVLPDTHFSIAKHLGAILDIDTPLLSAWMENGEWRLFASPRSGKGIMGMPDGIRPEF